MKQKPQKTEEEVDIAIANLLFSNLSLDKVEKIPKWLLKNIEKNKPKFKQALHSYTEQREQAVREEYEHMVDHLFSVHNCNCDLTLNDTDRV